MSTTWRVYFAREQPAEAIIPMHSKSSQRKKEDFALARASSQLIDSTSTSSNNDNKLQSRTRDDTRGTSTSSICIQPYINQITSNQEQEEHTSNVYTYTYTRILIFVRAHICLHPRIHTPTHTHTHTHPNPLHARGRRGSSRRGEIF
eukprot:GHVU01233909.1.p1 GENE.GHVU01233909.1~~GHVU01233909.1.p1  ORF type:complete len:147 (-),score=18.44 GHVU01233909.1:63-503(-)